MTLVTLKSLGDNFQTWGNLELHPNVQKGIKPTSLSEQSEQNYGKNELLKKTITELFVSKVEPKYFSETCASYVHCVNEVNPYLLQYHLEGMQKGWIVSVGGLRCMFDALLAPPDRLEGICIVDQDPDVVHAHRGLILLFLIAKTAKEARELFPLFASKPTEILDRLNSCERLSNLQKEYYIENLTKIGKPLGYMLSSQKEFDPALYAVKPCNKIDTSKIIERLKPLFFMHQEESFTKLQNLAKQGKIFAVTGNIYDLEFLQDLPIAVVDESNCHQYLQGRKEINLFQYAEMKRKTPINPILRILTIGAGAATFYNSVYDHQTSNPEKAPKLQGCLLNGPIGYDDYFNPWNFHYTGEDIQIPQSIQDFETIRLQMFSKFESED